MKTKLLKKVRKRFEIIEVTKYGKNDFKYLNVSGLKPPFYIIIDNNCRSPRFYYHCACQTYKEAFENLIIKITANYCDTSVKKLKSTKVYYIKP